MSEAAPVKTMGQPHLAKQDLATLVSNFNWNLWSRNCAGRGKAADI